MASVTSRRRVLVVEDERPIRELLRLHLDLAGFEIDETGDGRDALDRTRAAAFDLLILDVMLPGLDGVSLCRAVRAEGPNKETPILMLTARDGESDKVLGLESGADD
jgi:DNA-binding response OmpR family regulator